MTTLTTISLENPCAPLGDLLDYSLARDMTSTRPNINEVYQDTSSFLEVASRVPGCYIPKPIKDWRKLYPNGGELDCCDPNERWFIIGTDGILAWFYSPWSGKSLLGHLTSFNGPVAKHHVGCDMWDYDLRKPAGGLVRSDEDPEVLVPSENLQLKQEKQRRLDAILALLEIQV